MISVIYSKVSEEVVFTLYVYDGGNLIDSPTTPQIKSIFKPDLSEVIDFPQDMIKLETGTYFFKYIIPNHISSLGDFIVNIEYEDSLSNVLNKVYQIIVRRSDGLSNAFFIKPVFN